MDTLSSRIPNQSYVQAWAHRHRGKIAGLAAGTVGMWVLTIFLVVFITGEPFGGPRLDPDRTVVYPNF